MAFLNVFLRFLKFAFSLWLTASVVFMLSRFLPSANTPKGMAEADVSIYGATGAATLKSVRSDYLTRAGLNKPLFYFEVLLVGEKLAHQLKTAPVDKPWLEKAVLWHGSIPAENFYSTWQQGLSKGFETERKKLLQKLQSWSLGQSLEERKALEEEVTKSITTFPLSSSTQLLQSWKTLTSSSAPFYYYLPIIKWQGSDNIYHHWMVQILKGNLGISTQDYEPVSLKIKEAAGISMALACLGLALAMIVSYSAGMYFTEKPFSAFTFVFRQFLYVLDSIPAFLIALSLLGLFLLMGGAVLSPLSFDLEEENWLSSLTNPSLLLGSLCVSLLIIPHLTLQFHRSLADQTQQLYQRTGLAKGLTFKKTLRKHALPNALLPSITVLSEVIIGLMAGVLVVEITFSLPGIGSLLTRSILAADYPVMVALTLVFLIFRLFIVWITELAYALLDPRMKNN
ncbi:ABC transporter permease [Rufibacter latericius]|uniref:ABC transporter permease n=1 Tax=Rufibacter latericius TaxID=2487040 RepID=A0A3M9MHG0_9BACT|nr:ABC transporter permease [Rufibacter latericius]RNI24971.1 ABC transporter permease [Rufibacter latericius]